MTVVVAATLLLSSARTAQAETVSPKTVKILGAKGKLPKTDGAIGISYSTLKKQVKGGKLYGSEMGTYYATNNSTAI